VRVILDTNILLSGIISSKGTPAKLIESWLDRRFTLISHTIQLDELREVSRRPAIRALIRPADAGRLVNQIRLVAEIPSDLPSVERSPDPRDDFLLALCEVGKADWLITGDKDDLLALGRHGPTHIASASRLAEELGLASKA
jgi:putative PIN family toxin of toxin-antitoxin system